MEHGEASRLLTRQKVGLKVSDSSHVVDCWQLVFSLWVRRVFTSLKRLAPYHLPDFEGKTDC